MTRVAPLPVGAFLVLAGFTAGMTSVPAGSATAPNHTAVSASAAAPVFSAASGPRASAAATAPRTPAPSPVPAAGAAAAPSAAAPSPTGTTADTLVFIVADQGNEARYRVREQLARLDFPNDAVGVTSGVQGRILVTSDGVVIPEASRIIIDMTGLTSDNDRRDNFLRRNTLRTADYPESVFAPTEIRGLPNPLPSEGQFRFELMGEYTVRDVTRPITWDVEAEFFEGAIIGQARTRFTFGDFDIPIPSVGSVLSIRDEIRLEYDFRLVTGG